MSDVSMTLGASDAYKEKKLNVATRITSDILESEKDYLKIFYRLERCEETKDQTVEDNWKTVIAEKDAKTTNWETTPTEENYWSYYDSDVNGKDITLAPEQI